MTDAVLRRPKEFILGPLARRTPRSVHPTAITLVALVPGVASAAAAANGALWVALGLWLINRFLDGLDGTVARLHSRQSDLGAYLDITADFVVYAAVPIGLASFVGSREAWIAAAVLLATFYVNTVSWAYLAALLERRSAGTDRQPTMTAITMPGGLVEGAETILFFCAMFTFRDSIVALFWAMAVGVALTIAQRLVWALRNL